MGAGSAVYLSTSFGWSANAASRASTASCAVGPSPGPTAHDGCAPNEIAPIDVEVVDPNGYWRTATIADFGCRKYSSSLACTPL